MATYEKDSLISVRDEAGNLYLIYPITKVENVEGLEKAIAVAAGEVGNDLAAHLADYNNPHKVTPALIGAVATSTLGQPGGPAVLDKDGRLTSEQLGGTLGGNDDCGTGELQDTEMEVGTFTNSGAGWNTLKFREAFEDVPQVICQAENFDGTVLVKDITAEGFLYCLRTLQTGSYYTAAAGGTSPGHSATTLVSGTTTTAAAIKINYVAVEYGGER